jgi:hypothetical protein
VLIAVSAILLLPFLLWLMDQRFQTADGFALVDRLEVTEAGFFKLKRTGNTYNAPETAAGVVHQIADLQLLKEEPAKSAVVGTAFGVRFNLVSRRPSIEYAKLRSVWKIPPPGISNPKTGKTFREDVAEFNIMLGATGYRGFGFEESWEAIPGEWIVQIWQGDRMLLERSFLIK